MAVNISGETLTVQHVPLVHGQPAHGQMCSLIHGPTSPFFLGLSLSIPEVDCNYHNHSRSSSSNDKAESTDQADENPRRYRSSTTSQPNPFQNSDTPQWQNGNEVEDDNLDRDSLHNYCEASSFELHKNSNITQNRVLENSITAKMMHQSMYVYVNSKEHDQNTSLSDSELQHCKDSKNTPISMDYEEQEHDKDNDNEQAPKSLSDCESNTQNQTDYVTDSSCNSSDGILVNFSAIYSTDNSAVFSMPDDLDHPTNQSHWSASLSQDGDIKPIQCWSPCEVDPNYNLLNSDPSPVDIPDCTASLQSQDHLMKSVQNYYKLVTCDLSCLSSPNLECSSVNCCAEVLCHGSMSPPVEYYLFKQPEDEEGKVLGFNQKDQQVDGDTELNMSQRVNKRMSKGTKEKTPHNKTRHPNSSHEHRSAAQPQSRVKVKGHQYSPNHKPRLRVPSHPIQTDSWVPRCSSETDKDVSSHDSKQHVTSFVELAHCRSFKEDSPLVKSSVNPESTSPSSERKVQQGPNVIAISNQTAKISPNSGTSDTCNSPSAFQGPFAASPEVVRYSKAQRPTFLPIQPFVLQPPSGQQHCKDLGSLLSQFISHLHGKTNTSKNTGKCRQLTGHQGASPQRHYYSSHLESCSDTCSTCSPSPVESHSPPHLVQPRSLLIHTHSESESDQNTLDPSLLEKTPVQTCLNQNRPTTKQCYASDQQTSAEYFPTVDCLQTSHPVQVSSFQIPHALGEELPTPRPCGVEECGPSLHSLSPAITSRNSLTSDSYHIYRSGAGRRPPWPSDAALCAHISKDLDPTHISKDLDPTHIRFLLTEPQGRSDVFCQTVRSPQPSSASLSTQLLNKTDLLKPVSSAMGLITAHFSSCRDPKEKIRLGNSLLCPSINKLVLGQLCPAIQNVLQDGLRAFKRDLIVGRCRNKAWNVVETSVQPGPSTSILHNLVSVVRKCSQLTSHRMRLNAFFLGLLNLHALEEWFHHLHTCTGVVTDYYHPWAFLALSQGPTCGSLFQEFLLLLQPLSRLPFDLHLLSEVRLQSRSEQSERSSPSSHPLSACPLLQTPSRERSASSLERPTQREEREQHAVAECHAACNTYVTNPLSGCVGRFCKEPTLPSPAEQQMSAPPLCSRRERARWRLAEMCFFSKNPPHAGVIDLMVEHRERRTAGISEMFLGNKPPKEMHWAWLFGSEITGPVAVDSTQQRSKPPQRSRLPSEWLKLGASKMELLTQSVWCGEREVHGGRHTASPQMHKPTDRHTASPQTNSKPTDSAMLLMDC